MQTLSQNRKIAVSAIAVFIASFSFMLVFLGGSESNPKNGKTDLLHVDENTEKVEEIEDELSFVTDADGKIIESGDTFCQLIGKSCKLLIGSKIFDYINTEDLADFVSVHTKLVQGGEKLEGVGPFRFISGKKEKLLMLNAKSVSEGGKVVEIQFFATDLSEKIEKMNSDQQKNDKTWLELLYPKIKDVEGDKDEDTKLLVDKISYKKAD